MFDLSGDTLMAQILTDVIISNTKGDEKGDHFWDSATRSLAVKSQRTNNKYRCLDNW